MCGWVRVRMDVWVRGVALPVIIADIWFVLYTFVGLYGEVDGRTLIFQHLPHP